MRFIAFHLRIFCQSVGPSLGFQAFREASKSKPISILDNVIFPCPAYFRPKHPTPFLTFLVPTFAFTAEGILAVNPLYSWVNLSSHPVLLFLAFVILACVYFGLALTTFVCRSRFVSFFAVESLIAFHFITDIKNGGPGSPMRYCDLLGSHDPPQKRPGPTGLLKRDALG